MSPYSIVITFVNGSRESIPFTSAIEARRYARDKISYSGGRIARVQLTEPSYVYNETLWAEHWDAVSKAAGLTVFD